MLYTACHNGKRLNPKEANRIHVSFLFQFCRGAVVVWEVMPLECVGWGWSGGVGDASECRAKSDEEVAPDGAVVSRLELRAKVRYKGTCAVVSLESSSDRGEGGGCGVSDSNSGEWGVGEGGRDGILCKAP